MRLKDHLGVFLVILLVVTVLRFGVFTGYQTIQGIDVGIILPVNYRSLNPASFPDNTPLVFDVAVQNYGTTQTIGQVGVIAELYNLATNTYITGQSKTTNNYLNSGSSASLTFNFGTLPAGQYGIGIRISATNDVNPTNNEHPEFVTVVATAPPPPPALVDLRIANVKYPGGVSSYNVGQNVVFDVQVSNILNGVTTNPIAVVATIYDRIGNNIGTITASDPSGLGGGQSVLLPFNLGNLPADNYQVDFQVYNLDDSVIDQYNQASSNFNVVQTIPAKNVDLAVKPVIFPSGVHSYQTTQNIDFNVEATNLGTSATSNPVLISAKILDGSSGAVLVQDVKQASTGANAGQTVSTVFSFTPLSQNDYGLQVEVMNADDGNSQNNVQNTVFKVVPATPAVQNPDLELVSVQINTYAANQIPANTPYTATVTFKNKGIGDTRAFANINFGIFDLTGNTLFQDVKNINRNVLAGQQTTEVINLPGRSAGSYELKTIIDYNGLTGDIDLTNNIGSIPITIIGSPVQSICNNNDICETDSGEDATNCANDCSLGNDATFCNTADKSDISLVGGMLQFTDANSIDHSVTLNSLSLATKSFQLNYDGSNINMNLRTPKVTSDYEVRAPIIGVHQGKNFAFVCFKVNTLTPVIGQCNNNKICESNLGETVNTCQLDCIATQSNVQFCSASNKIDYARTLTMSQAGQSVDQYNQPHIIKFVSMDKTNSKIKVQYDRDVLDLTPGTLYSVANYELLPLLINEDFSTVTQSLITKAFLCAKHKARPTGTTPRTGITPGAGTQTGTTPGQGTVTGVQFFNVNLIVKDKDTKQPIENVKVNFYVYIQFSDSAGKTAFKTVPPGMAKYKFSSAGYKTLEGEIDVTKNGDFIFELEKGVSADFPVLATVLDKAQIIVGKKAMPADVFTAELLKKSLSKNSVVLKDGMPALQVGIIPSIEKVPVTVGLDDSTNIYLPNTHSILIGSACNNKLTKATLELTAGEDCNKGVIPGQARIQLKTLHGGKSTIIMVYGVNEEDTRMAAQALTRGLKETLIGTDFRVSQEYGELKVTKLG